ncbi:MAG TPA: SAM-dependent methyltransferase [Thermoanaerobaculia bacterium]|nr:SAM-dependent methyltransferase [Thermoanaerobaculia bacterium]
MTRLPETPSAARIYSYTLGGSHYFPVDQAAAEYMFSLVPSTPKWVRMLRDFLQRAARQLWAAGYTHFVDLASGLPTEDHIHHVLPEARIIYSDIDPLTCAEGQEIVQALPNVLYLCHDVRQVKSLLSSPEVREFLGGERQLAFGLNGITVFLSPEEISKLFRELYAWAAHGSRIYITYETKAPHLMTPRMEEFFDMFRRAGAPFWLYTLSECLELSAPWRLPPQGLVPLADFLGMPAGYITEEDHEGVGLEFYAAILEKP